MSALLAFAHSLGAVHDAPHTLAASDSTAIYEGSFSVYSDPVNLRYGQVAFQSLCDENYKNGDRCGLPQDVIARYAAGTGRKMGVSGVAYDIVKLNADGIETSVPLYEVYNHHSSVMITGDSAQDTEGTPSPLLLSWTVPDWTRGTPHMFPVNYRDVITEFAPTKWQLGFHVINTRKPDLSATEALNTMVEGKPLPLYLAQCPCSPQRDINLTANTIDGKSFPPCPSILADANNPKCDLATYTGGMNCCDEDGMFIIDTDVECQTPNCSENPVDVVHFKATVWYQDAVNTTVAMDHFYNGEVMNAENPADLSYQLANYVSGEPLMGVAIEPGINVAVGTDFIIPKAPEGTPPELATYTLTYEKPLKLAYSNFTTVHLYLPYQLVQVYAHVHTGAISTLLEDAGTNQTICYASLDNGMLLIGDGLEAGNERGYIRGEKMCDFGTNLGPRIHPGQRVRVTTTYNSSVEQMGVMSGWFMVVAPIPEMAALYEAGQQRSKSRRR